MLQTPCFTCVNGVYVAIYGHMNLIFTQDEHEAREVALLMGSSDEPYWWIERTSLTPQTYPLVVQTIQEIYRLLGRNGLTEFTSYSGYDFSVPYTGQEGVFCLHGFVF